MLDQVTCNGNSRSARSRWGDRLFQWGTQLTAIGVIALVVGIALELLIPAIPAIRAFNWQFLITSEWNPVQNTYGILPQIYGTLVSSLLAVLLAVPLGVSIAVFLSENWVPRTIRVPLSFLIELLAAIPSVVYGLWGIFVLIPALMPVLATLHHKLGWIPIFASPPSSRAILPTVIVLMLMIVPTIAALSRDALEAQPPEMRLGAAALGATRWETLLQILIPASASGIVGAAVLALGRALGETMATVMLIGNAHQIQLSLLAPGSTIASLIANEFTESRGLQISALLYAALVLMAITLVINAIASMILHSPAAMAERSLSRRPSRPHSPMATVPGLYQPNVYYRRIVSILCTIAITLGTAIIVLGIGSILISLIWQGWSRLDVTAFRELPPPPLDQGGGFHNALVGTLLMVAIGTCLSAPVGVLTAIYVVEFGGDRLLARTVRFFNSILSGVPSILCGLFAYSVVVLTTGRFSAVAGGVALAVVMVPMIVRTAEEGLKAVSPELRAGAIALGASPAQTVGQIVIPAATPTLTTGIILAIARAAGETAPLLFTALFSQYGLTGLWHPVASLSVLVYNFALSPYPNHQALAWTAALVIVGLILGVSIVARRVTAPRW